MAAQIESELEKQFRENAPPAWKSWEQQTKKIQLRVSISNKTTYAAKTHADEWKNEILIKQRTQSFLRLDQAFGEKGNTRGELAVINPAYWFELNRSTPEKSWILGQFSPVSRPPPKPLDPRLTSENLLLWPISCKRPAKYVFPCRLESRHGMGGQNHDEAVRCGERAEVAAGAAEVAAQWAEHPCLLCDGTNW